MALEQAYYSWSTKDLGGRNQLQIVGLSDGLTRAPLQSAMTAVRRMCRYDFPAQKEDPQPISFGWFDFDDVRLAFCRVALDVPPAGNFSAHVLVGTRDELSESAVASWFSSPFWWTGSPLVERYEARANGMFEIPAVAAGDISRAPMSTSRPDPNAVDSLIHMLVTLGDDRKVAVNENSWTFGEQIRVVASECPVALDGVSLSTYEGAPTFPFSVVGDQKRRAGQRAVFTPGADALDPTAREALARLRTSATGSRTLLAAGVQGASGLVGSQRRKEFWNRVRGIVAVAVGLEAARPDLLTALETADGATYVVTAKPGKSRIAEAISTGEPGVRESLRRHVASLAPDALEALSTSTLARYVAAHAFGGCGDAAVLFPPTSGQSNLLLEGILAALVETSAGVETLQPEDTLALLRQATETRRPSKQVFPLVLQGAPQAARAARDPRIADDYVAAMVSFVLRDPALHKNGVVAEVLTSRPSVLAGTELADDEQAHLAHAMGDLGSQTLTGVLQGVLGSFTSLDVLRDVRTLLSRFPLPAASRLVIEAARRRGSPSPLLATLSIELAEELLTSAGYDVRHLKLPYELLQINGGRDATSAMDILDRVSRSRLHSSTIIGTADDALALESAQLRNALWSLILQTATDSVTSTDDVRPLWRLLDGSYPTARDALHALLEQAGVSIGLAPRLYILAWVGDDLLARDPRLVNRSGRLKDDASQQLSETIVATLPHTWLEQWEQVGDRSGPGARQWWSHLLKHAYKLHREHGGVARFVSRIRGD